LIVGLVVGCLAISAILAYLYVNRQRFSPKASERKVEETPKHTDHIMNQEVAPEQAPVRKAHVTPAPLHSMAHFKTHVLARKESLVDVELDA
jgi:hypothetical protein